MNINLFAAIPEIFVTFMIMVVLLVDAFVSEEKNEAIKLLTIVTLIGGYILEIWVYAHGHGSISQTAFNDMFILDNMAFGMKLFTYIFAIILVLYIDRYLVDKKLNK